MTGGYVYRGAALPELFGAYLFADYCLGELRALAVDDGQVVDEARPSASTPDPGDEGRRPSLTQPGQLSSHRPRLTAGAAQDGAVVEVHAGRRRRHQRASSRGATAAHRRCPSWRR